MCSGRVGGEVAAAVAALDTLAAAEVFELEATLAAALDAVLAPPVDGDERTASHPGREPDELAADVPATSPGVWRAARW